MAQSNFLKTLLLPWVAVAVAGWAGARGADQTDEGVAPTWETQKQAGTHTLLIPAPRGQITDRNGNPLAQSRVSQNLALQFPTPLNFTEAHVLSFAHAQMREAARVLGREVSLPDEQIVRHYKNRGVLPLDLAQDLKPAEIEAFKAAQFENLTLHPVYERFYPNGPLAGHLIGYAGRTGRALEGPIQNNDSLWPGSEGREGLEQAFNEQLAGKPGQLNLNFDARGHVSEKVSIAPQPGYNVITTIDENLQRLAEEALAKGTKRGALVLLDPNNGDVLAMASWPVFDPNGFVPNISAAAFKALQDDPDIPLIPRAYRSAYPAGSTFKVFVGLAALQSGAIKPDDEFNCPAAFDIGNLTFRNWKKEGAGMMNFVGALTQSCNTWFYQVGLKTGGKPITEWAKKVGLGAKTGIPLHGEIEGRIPDDEYMRKTYGRPQMQGDIANLAIGQGDVLISPLQMAQAMATIANGGTLYQTRLVQQVQTIDNQVITAYDVRAREQLPIRPEVIAELKKAMVSVVSSRAGTAGRAAVDGIDVAGKTGTAQWGPKKKERTAAWFAGFAPAGKPKYAFAALYEGEANDNAVHGGTQAAPLIGKVLNELFKKEGKKGKSSKPAKEDKPADEPAPEPDGD